MATYNETASGGVEFSGSPSVGVASRDTFTGTTGTGIASHTPDTGGSWTIHSIYSGAGVVIGSGNTVTMTSGTSGLAYLNPAPSSQDYDVSIDVDYHITVLGSNNYRGGVAGRISTSENTFYRAKVGNYIYFDGDFYQPGVMLEKVVTGTATQIGSTVAYSGGRLTLRMVGSSISVLEDDAVSIGPETDTAITAAGRAGVWFETASGLQWFRLDNFAVDGPSQLYAEYYPPASGGIEAAGSVGGSVVYKPTASGGLQTSGSAVPGAGFSEIGGSGGVQSGGSAAPTVTYTLDPTGGVESSGSTGSPLGFTEYASGGVESSGSATPTKRYNAYPTGGIQSSGSSILGQNYVQTAAGGVQTSGSAAPSVAYSFAPSGGVENSGHFGPPDVWPYLASGGVESSGSAEPLVVFNHPTSGGIESGGSAAASAEFIYNATASGGVQSGGTVPISGLAYMIYANAGDGGPIDYDTPIAEVVALTWTSDELAAPGVWKFGVRATAYGLEEKNLDAYVKVELDGSGVDVTNTPLAPAALTAWPIAGGGIRVAWAYPSISVANVTGFRVFKGIGSPDYGTIAATKLAATPTGSYRVDLAGLTDGVTYTIGVRSYNATGEERNTTTVTATADATGPGPVDGLTISTDPGDW